MANWGDIVDDYLEITINKGIINADDTDSQEDFRDAMYDAFRDENGDFPDHFPNAREVDEKEWKDILDFFDEYDLWEDVREDWEDYEKA